MGIMGNREGVAMSYNILTNLLELITIVGASMEGTYACMRFHGNTTNFGTLG